MYNKQRQSSSSSFVKVPNVVLSQHQEDVIASLIETFFAVLVPVEATKHYNNNDDEFSRVSLASLDNTTSTTNTTNATTSTIGTILVNDIQYRTTIHTVITQQLTSYIRFLIVLAINLLSNRFGMILICFGKNRYLRHRTCTQNQHQIQRQEQQQQQQQQPEQLQLQNKRNRINSPIAIDTSTHQKEATFSITNIIYTIKTIIASFYNTNSFLQFLHKYIIELILYDTIYYYFICYKNNNLKSFPQLSREERIELLQYIENPTNTIFKFQNQLFHGIKRLICTIAYTYYNTNTNTATTNIGTSNTYHNPLWNHIHYPGPIQQSQQQQQQQQKQQEHTIDFLLSKSTSDTITCNRSKKYNKKRQFQKQIQIQQHKKQKQFINDDTKYVQYATQEQQQLITQIAEDTDYYQQRRQTVSINTNESNPILHDNDDMDSNSNNNDIIYDIIIVGSGASGSVATYVLSSSAKLNLSILIIEEGSYHAPNDISNIEKSSFTNMYQNNGYLTTKDSSIVILAGKTFGGGTTINWSCSIPLPLHILTEWNTILSLDDYNNGNNQQVVFGTDYYQSLQFILQHITGNSDYEQKSNKNRYNFHNTMNQIAISGYDTLQFHWIATKLNIIPNYFTTLSAGSTGSNKKMRNLSLLTNSGGYICFGDRYGIKNGSIRSFFLPAITRYQKRSVNKSRNYKQQHHHHRLLQQQLRQEIPPPIVQSGSIQVPTTEDDTDFTSNNNNDNNIRETSNKSKNTGSIHFLTNCKVVRVLTTTKSNDNEKYEPYDIYPSMVRRRAIGVECQLTNYHQSTTTTTTTTAPTTFTIRAKKAVILSAGALQTPCILQRSNFQSKHIGQHLWLHPVMIPMGYTTTMNPTTVGQGDNNESRQKQHQRRRHSKQQSSIKNEDDNNDIIVNPFYGLPMTTACTEFHQSYRYLLECPATHPGLPAAFIPWKSPIEYWNKMSNFHKLVPMLILQRDYSSLYVTDTNNNNTGSRSSFIKWFDRRTKEGGGSVHSNRYGELVVDYKIHPQDVHSLMHGVQTSLRVLKAAGLTTVYSSCVSDNNQYPVVNSTSTTMACSIICSNQQRNESTSIQSTIHIDDYINNTIRPIQYKQYESSIASAHQMGTCRISTIPQNGVVDYLNAETWECNNLYIYDTSIFPTASGSNPMITVLTLSHMFSQRLLQRFKYQHDTNIYQQIQLQKQQSSSWWKRRGQNRIPNTRTTRKVSKNDLLLTKQQYDILCQLEQQRIEIRKNGIPLIGLKTSIIIRTIVITIVQIILGIVLFIIGTTTWIKYDFENNNKMNLININ